MITTKTSKPAATTTDAKKADVGKPEMVTLDQLAREMKMTPREARMLLRLAVSKKGEYPALAEQHVPRQPWQWEARSKALDEARRAIADLKQ